jgi:predicted phage tail protein
MKFSGGSKPKVPVQTPDTYAAQDTVEMVLAIGKGTVLGLVDGMKTVYLDGTPIQAVDGTPNFGSVDVEVVYGTTPNEEFKMRLGGTGTSTRVGTQLAANVPVVRGTTQANVDFIDIRFAIQQLSETNTRGIFEHELILKVEVKDRTSPTWTPANFFAPLVPPAGTGLVVIAAQDPNATPNVITKSPTPPLGSTSNDVWIGSDNVLKVYENQTWVQDQNTSYDAGQQVWSRGNGVRIVGGVSDIPNEVDSVGLGDSVILSGQSNGLTYNGAAWADPRNSMDFLYPAIGTGTSDGTIRIRQKVSSTSSYEIRFPVQRRTELYDLRITKLSVDSNSTGIVSEVAWESFQEIRNEPLKLHGLAAVKLYARTSDQFASIPTVTADWYLKIIAVPTNYNPQTRTYSGVWDGTWKKVYSNNPMWVVCDLIVDEIDGMSAVFPHTFNKWDAYELAQWYDEPVSNGQGGTRPRFTYNRLDTQAIAIKQRIRDILGGCATRMVEDGAGSVTFIADINTDPVMLFTVENTVAPQHFTYTPTDIRSQHNNVVVQFLNEELDYNEDTRLITDAPHAAVHGDIRTTIFAPGKTNASEAVALGLYHMITNITEDDVVSFETDRRARYLNLWDVVLIADERRGWGVTRRCTSWAGAIVQLDEVVSLEPGVSYKITVETGAMGPVVANVTSPPGITASLQLDIAFPIGTEQDAPVILSNVDTVGLPQRYRITDVSASEDKETYKISALKVNPIKDYLIHNWTGTAYTADSILTNSRYTGRVRNAEAYFIDGQIVISWDAPLTGIVSEYQVDISPDREGTYTRIHTGKSRTARYTPPGAFDLLFWRIYAVPLIGPVSIPVEGVIDMAGVSRPVGPIGGLILVESSTSDPDGRQVPLYFTFRWDASKDVKGTTYEVVIRGQNNAVLRLRIVDIPIFIYTLEQVKSDGAGRLYTIEVTALNPLGDRSKTKSLVVSNLAPAAPTGVTSVFDADSILINWSRCTDADFLETVVSVNSIIVARTTGTQFRHPISTHGTYIVRVGHRDTLSPSLPEFSTVVSTTIVLDQLYLAAIADAKQKADDLLSGVRNAFRADRFGAFTPSGLTTEFADINSRVTLVDNSKANNTTVNAIGVRLGTAEGIVANQNSTILTLQNGIATKAESSALNVVSSALGNTQGQVTQLATSVSTLDGKVSNYYGVILSGNGETSFGLMNGTGLPYGGIARLKAANFSIEGQMILNGLNIGDLTRIANVTNPGDISIGVGFWTTVCQVTINKGSNDTVLLVDASVVIDPPERAPFACELRVLRNGNTQVYLATGLNRAILAASAWRENSTSIASPAFADAVSAGSHTYEVQIRTYNNTGICRQRHMRVQENIK